MRLFPALLLLTTLPLAAETAFEPKPEEPYFAPYQPLKAPAPGPLLLKEGDQLAICGDSITQQKMYSRIMETYLAVCTPELHIQARQLGWSGERASGFLTRMKNDCLRFSPTVATLCYGMNDHQYQPPQPRIAASYRESMTAVVETFEAAGVRVVVGSPGSIGKMPVWVKTAFGCVEDLNASLCDLRNIDIEIAESKHAAFADVFWPMFTDSYFAKKIYGPDYALTGKDGVHPGWAGHLVMAYTFLKALGLQGDIGEITVDLASGKATASSGHEVSSSKQGEVTLLSHRYPFCATGPADRDESIRSGMELIPFNAELNRFILKASNTTAASYKVTWGAASRSYPADALRKGVNLAADFAENPFTAAFNKVDAAVAAKEAFEQTQIQKDFRSAKAKADMEAVAKRTEEEHARLAAAIDSAFVPVTHTITITAE